MLSHIDKTFLFQVKLFGTFGRICYFGASRLELDSGEGMIGQELLYLAKTQAVLMCRAGVK